VPLTETALPRKYARKFGLASELNVLRRQAVIQAMGSSRLSSRHTLVVVGQSDAASEASACVGAKRLTNSCFRAARAAKSCFEDVSSR
jgi:hypothetical protein